MSVHDELAIARHALIDLVRSVGRLQTRLGDVLDVRRVQEDADRLREDLDLLQEGSAAKEPTPGPAQSEIVLIPQTPYDLSMWVGCDDEGIGSGHGPELRR
ncbi:hypothetical protein [Streptomyces ureilyticus]|uniref:Uncharacterized protein n=1 Tax=Streptomyces ureilyticus TaxID=1775131 RepID=A0ABX0DY43_9ACTN|nr:hypothetical protein [Streptomyces ureilyticus]NGO45560.1 hypothetical protein [Streptomyces ureilyticus]